jgi:hypothetical protein
MEVPFAAPERELSKCSAICYYLLWLRDKENPLQKGDYGSCSKGGPNRRH